MPESGALFLEAQHKLNKSRAVSSAERWARLHKNIAVAQSPDVRVQNYLERLKGMLQNPDTERRDRAQQLLRQFVLNTYAVTPAEVLDYYIETDQRMAHQLGHGRVAETPDLRLQYQQERKAEIDEVIDNQTSSLDEWIEYFLEEGPEYPDWLKYYAFKGILDLGTYNHHLKKFPKRSLSTIDHTSLMPFPELNREVLAQVLDQILEKYKDITDPTVMRKLVANENFATQYASFFKEQAHTDQEFLKTTAGKWEVYKRGSDPSPLVTSLRGHRTGWCTAGTAVAEKQLRMGDFHVYYTNDEQGKPSHPRIAIRMEHDELTGKDSIAEVRGIAAGQNLDPFVAHLAEAKLATFPDGKEYQKKSKDMQLLTTIERKIKQKTDLTKEEIRFLYELDSTIEGFGYSRDPRIKLLRKTRNQKEDLQTALDLSSDEIAWDNSEVSVQTRVYVGELFPGLFTAAPNIEHIYTYFPDHKISVQKIQFERETLKSRIERLSTVMEINNASLLLSSEAAVQQPKPLIQRLKSLFNGGQEQRIQEDVILLTVKDLNIYEYTSVENIIERAKELGLGFCNQHAALEYAAKAPFSALHGVIRVATEPNPDDKSFRLNYFSKDQDGGRYFNSMPANYQDCGARDAFLFAIPKPPANNTTTA